MFRSNWSRSSRLRSRLLLALMRVQHSLSSRGWSRYFGLEKKLHSSTALRTRTLRLPLHKLTTRFTRFTCRKTNGLSIDLIDFSNEPS